MVWCIFQLTRTFTESVNWPAALSGHTPLEVSKEAWRARPAYLLGKWVIKRQSWRFLVSTIFGPYVSPNNQMLSYIERCPGKQLTCFSWRVEETTAAEVVKRGKYTKRGGGWAGKGDAHPKRPLYMCSDSVAMEWVWIDGVVVIQKILI